MSKGLERQRENKILFTTSQKDNIISIFNLVDEALENTLENLKKEYGQASIRKAETFEVEINNERNKLRSQHLGNLETGEYGIESGMIYNDLFSSCEKIGDHIFNVNEALVGIK